MIHLKLGPRRRLTPADPNPLNRDWYGYDTDMTEQDVYDRNRGDWVLGARAKSERYAIFSDTGSGRICCVVELDGIQSLGAKSAIVGRVLPPEHPMHARVGQPAPDNFRNPVTYVPDAEIETTCACGCGTAVSGRSNFVAGHDQRAVHSRITAQWGSTVGFVQWFDRTYGRPETAAQFGEQSSDLVDDPSTGSPRVSRLVDVAAG